MSVGRKFYARSFRLIEFSKLATRTLTCRRRRLGGAFRIALSAYILHTLYGVPILCVYDSWFGS